MPAAREPAAAGGLGFVQPGVRAFEITFGYAEQLQAEPATANDAYERVADEVLKCTVSPYR